MRFRLLGTTRAFHDDGTPVALGGARLRALLTVLALRTGREVPARVLVAEIWDGEPPADAVAALQALVGRLRRALGHAAVASTAGGYRLCADGDEVDLHRFGRLATEGARALADGQPAEAAALLDEALALWQGQVLADLPDRAVEAARWETRRLEARRARLTAALALGHAVEALPELAALCGEFPLDEPLQALRVRALRDASRTAEALAAYEEVRRGLADRLGVDPGPELRTLHEELLHDGAGTPAAGPAGGTAGPKSGLPAGAPPRPAPYGNLRARLTSFVGREDDIEALRHDLGKARLVTLLGPGGAGKTRLSQEAAERAAAAWPDGVWLAELAPVDDPSTVAEAVLTSLGVRETVLRGAGAEELRAADRQGGEPLARLAEHCARRRMLLLLDNCEHVVEAAAALAEELLTRCPDLTVLATSREPLGVPGEVVRPVEPLSPDSAHRLFAERARAVRPGFDGTQDPEAVAEICRRLDGLPLAIELAAARLRLLSPRQIADRLDDRFRLLSSGSRTVLPRQQTLRAVVDWSWDLLDARERAVLSRLSVFAGGCGLPAAEAVCADGGAPASAPRVEVHDVPDLLGSLIDKSLVVATPTPDGDMRYRLLETVAEYAAERLDEAGDRAASERRHLVHHREMARTTDPELRGHGQRAGLALLQLEYENIRTALRRAVAAGDEQESLCLILSLAWFWAMRDMRAEARQWATAAAALGPDPFASPVEPAPPLGRRCIDQPPPMAGDQLTEARRETGLIKLVNAERAEDEWITPERTAWLENVTAVYGPGLPQTCRFPGSLWLFALLMTGDDTGLRTAMDDTVEACERFGYDWELAGALHMRANVLANRGAWAGDAGRDADRALAIYERIGDAWGIAEALSVRGEAREQRGSYALAADDYAAAVRHAEGLGARSQVAVLRSRLANVLMETDRAEEGERMLRAVLEDHRDTSHEALLAARLFLAMRLGRTGRRADARAHLQLLRTEFRGEVLPLFEGFVKGALAWLDCMDGRYAEALAGVRDALRHASSKLSMMVAPDMAANHLVTAAWARAGLAGGDKDQAYEAARLFGASEALTPAGHFRAAPERELRARALEAVVAAVGDDAAFEAARAEGGGLTMEEATARV